MQETPEDERDEKCLMQVEGKAALSGKERYDARNWHSSSASPAQVLGAIFKEYRIH